MNWFPWLKNIFWVYVFERQMGKIYTYCFTPQSPLKSDQDLGEAQANSQNWIQYHHGQQGPKYLRPHPVLSRCALVHQQEAEVTLESGMPGASCSILTAVPNTQPTSPPIWRQCGGDYFSSSNSKDKPNSSFCILCNTNKSPVTFPFHNTKKKKKVLSSWWRRRY